MKYYLSSYKLGNETPKLTSMISMTNKKFGYIPNARDFTGADPDRKNKNLQEDINDLMKCGAQVEVLDLRDYFGKEDELKKKINELGGVYVSGGNTFVLRQAMRLSGFDKVITNISERDDFLYVAYSAGVCVITPNLKAYSITDDANDFPYPDISEQIWEGLGFLDFIFEPHFKSDHPESASTDKEVEYCIENKILFKAYRDGEVLIIE